MQRCLLGGDRPAAHTSRGPCGGDRALRVRGDRARRRWCARHRPQAASNRSADGGRRDLAGKAAARRSTEGPARAPARTRAAASARSVARTVMHDMGHWVDGPPDAGPPARPACPLWREASKTACARLGLAASSAATRARLERPRAQVAAREVSVEEYYEREAALRSSTTLGPRRRLAPSF